MEVGENSSTRQQKAIVSGIDLGQGFNQTAQGQERKPGNTCFDVDKKIENVGELDVRAFYSYSSKGNETRLKVNTKGSAKLENFGFDFQSLFENVENSQSEEAYITILVHVKTIRRYAEGGSGETIDTPSICHGDPPGDYEAFVAECGTSWLKSETLGGYVALTSSLDSLSTKQKRELGAKLGVNTEKGAGAVEFSFSQIQQQEYESLRFTLQNVGSIPTPSEDTSEPKDELDPGDLANYANTVTQSYEDAYNAGVIDAEEYGVVIDQDFNRYSPQNLADCGLQNTTSLQCYLDFHKRADELENMPGKIERKFNDLVWRLSHPDKVKWPVDKEAAMGKYEAVANQIDTCLATDIPNAESTCNAAYDNGGSDMCTACEFPDGCSLTELENRIESLPDTSIDNGLISVNNYSRVNVGHNQAKAFGSSSSDLCALGRIGGGFYGGGEQIELMRDGSAWSLHTVSQRTKSTREISAAMNCVPRSAFTTDETPEPTWTMSSNSVTGGESGSSVQIQANDKYAGMITGLSGEMGGGGERVYIDNTPDPYRLTAASQQGTMWGRSLSFGMNEIGGDTKVSPFKPGVKRKKATSNGKRQVYLAEATEAFCYVSRVQGEFDGTGESVLVEEKSGQWYLSVHAACEDRSGFLGMGKRCKERKQITAYARCYSYDQTP